VGLGNQLEQPGKHTKPSLTPAVRWRTLQRKETCTNGMSRLTHHGEQNLGIDMLLRRGRLSSSHSTWRFRRAGPVRVWSHGIPAPRSRPPSGVGSAADRRAVRPVRSQSWRRRTGPACDTTPVPPPVTSSPRDHAVAFTWKVLLELVRQWISTIFIVPVQEYFSLILANSLSRPREKPGSARAGIAAHLSVTRKLLLAFSESTRATLGHEYPRDYPSPANSACLVGR